MHIPLYFKLTKLTERYQPIEHNQSILNSEKIPIMQEWWDLSHKCMIEAGLHRDKLSQTVESSLIVLRDRVPEFLSILNHREVPVLIFSAGLGNVIELILERFKICHPNIRIVSNFMDFNQEGVLSGFQEPLIHSYNKNAASISNTDFFTTMLMRRQSVLLLGDSIGDIHMADGLFHNHIDLNCSTSNYNSLENGMSFLRAGWWSEDSKRTPSCTSHTVLRIGFLNHSVCFYRWISH
ncbi:unnamed protein product [Protopolystoma xenopodis]|uniref:5'-nucleotidase n=1 Tax=Protopolystoma xenopodis TaxID=117903 RepID=A0A448XBZ2_9PLAT|nr:unnamed protein product [Protopolystoma xenopodis]